MSPYDVRLTSSEEIAEGTMAFHFEKPAGFAFKPGQAIDVILAQTPSTDEQSARHTFSIVSAPYQQHLTVATRMRDSAFKRTLKTLPTGSPLRLEGPFGSLTLHNNRARPAVFIAGGIGITPIVSILRQAAKDEIPHRLVLIYSNRRPEDAAFLDELQQIERQYSHLRFIPTMTQMDKSGRSWTGETGIAGQDLVSRIVSDLQTPIYYLVGPPAMVEGLRLTLNTMRVDDDDIRSEDFFGY